VSDRRAAKRHDGQALARRPVAPPADRSHRFQPTALVLPERLPFDAWERLGHDVLRPMARGVQWWIGDWLNYGERRYGEKYAQAIDATGYDYSTLNGMRWVAERIAIVRRRTSLSWAHHREVAALEPAAQTRWLRTAEREELSRAALRTALRDAKLLPAMPTAEPVHCTTCGQPLVCPHCPAEAARAPVASTGQRPTAGPADLHIEPLGQARFRVTGGTDPHVVVAHPHGSTCDCKGFRYRHACRHVAAVARHGAARQCD
jgi:hypothetical protein